jgi:dynein heavy chain
VTTVLEKISTSIKEASQGFWRWMDGYCMFCEKKQSRSANEEVQYHTFYSQIIKNPIITRIAMQIGIIREKASDKVNNFKEMWEDEKKKPLWDQKAKHAVEKIIDKNPTTIYLEF